MSLYAIAGASIALEASAALMLTADKQGLRGVPKDKKVVKAKVGASGEAKIFAGLKEGIDLSGALQWLNPEGFIDEKSPKRKDPKKTWGEYADIASVTAGVAAIQGLAATLGFEVSYRNGNFVIAAKAAGCLGLGGSGNVAAKVGAEQIGQMFMCVAHQLKQADYSKLTGLMEHKVFESFNQILYMVQVGEKQLRDFAGSAYRDVETLNRLYQKTVNTVQQKGLQLLHDLEQQLRTGWGWFAYMPPEARGALISSIIDVIDQPQYAGNRDMRQLAAFAVNELLATTQSRSHLDNTMDRITVALGEKVERGQAEASVNRLLLDSKYAGGLNRAVIEVAKASPIIQRPFMRNDDPSFYTAQLPLQHPTALG